MFAEVLHIRPWETGDLTAQQISEAAAYFDELKGAGSGK